MRKSLKYVLLSVVLILCVVLGVKGYILQVASGTWAAQASLTQARSGASAVLLQDGRILVTGGDGVAGTLASAEIIGLDGTSSAAASMSTTRSKHVSAVLANGSVLVAGGTTSGGGAINTAEIYDPVANSWTTVAGAMIEARSNATAIVLQDGRVLIAGGDRSGVASSTIEIFDPVALTFSFAGALASPRTDHAMARLSDGRVFIAGGSNGSAALNTTDIYDPIVGSVNAGPALSTLRMGHSATTMLDGRVLIAGGNNGTTDLASAEILDPVAGTITAVASSLSTTRQGHLAFLLPNNNAVLIVGGTSAGVPLASAEVFTPWLGTFAPTGSLTVARNNSAGSPMKQDGLLVVAGGQDASGVALTNTDIYGFATVKTDAADYPPGTIVNITGAGWQPGETVTLTLVESPLIDTHGPFTVVADANGGISNSSFVTDLHDIDVSFHLTAVGAISQAQTTFTDAAPPSISSLAPNTAVAGSGAFTLTVNGSNFLTGAQVSFNGNNRTTTFVSPIKVTAAILATDVQSAGTFVVRVTNPDNHTDTANFVVTKASTTTTITNSGTLGTATVVGQPYAVNYSVTVTPPGSGTPTGNVTVSDGTATCTGTVAAGSCSLISASVGTPKTLVATYAGDVNFNASTSGGVSHTVSQASTTTTIALTSGTNPSSSGQSVTFTATVAAVAPGAGTATGTVTFKDGAANIGTGTLSGGTATLTTNTLTVGSHSITAVYGGDTNFIGSTSSALSQTVVQGGTITTITAHTPSPSVVGQAVNITFTVTSTGGTPTGNVTVSDGAGDSCTATVAVGTCSITFPASGIKTLSAVYAGDTNFTGSTSANVSHTVIAAATTTTITGHTPNPSLVGQPITVNYSVTVNSPGSGTIPATDNVTVSDGTGDSCTGTVTAGTCQLIPTTTGAKTLVATFATGDANFATSTSTGVAHTVNQAPTITSANSTTFVVGTAGSFTVTATGFPTPTFTETGALPSGVTLSAAGVLSGTPAANTGGTYPITITANNGVSPNGTQSFVLTVNQAPAITSANATSFVANTSGTFTFTATGFPTAMSFTETGTLPSGVTLSSAGVLSGTTSVTGTFPITVTASNGITPNGTQSFTLTVGQAPAFTSANNAAFSVLTAGSFTVAASGFPSSTFTTASALPSGVTLTSAGALSGTPASGTAGSYPLIITAHNGVGTDATQNFTLAVNKLTPIFSPALSSPAPIAFGTATVSLPPVGVMVTTGSIRASSPDTVTISINGTSSGPISFNGQSGTFGPFAFNTQTSPVGTYPITYTYNGGLDLRTITDSSTTLTVNKANQTITVPTPAPAAAAFNSNFTVAATASSGLPVTFSSSGACTNVNATFTMNSGTGTCTVKFDQAGNSNYSAAPEITETVTAQQSTATVTLSNLTQTYTGAPLTPTATTNPLELTIVWTGAPDTNVGSYAVTAKVSDPNYQGSASGTFTITGVATATSVSAPPVTYPANGTVTVTVSSGAGIPAGNATLVVDGGLPLFAALNSSGIATFTITNPNPGTHALSASYAAQGNFAASGPATTSLAVSQAPVITSDASTTFTAGAAGSFTVTTMGVPFPSLSETGGLPNGITFTDNSNGTATLAGTTIVAGTYPITIIAANGVGLPATQTFTLTVSAGAFTQLQVLVPGETAAPGTASGKTGTPGLEYVNGAFNVTVNAVDDNWNVVRTVSDTVHITSNDAKAVSPTDAALVSGTGTFSVTLETVADPAATTITASDATNTGIAGSTTAPVEVVVAYTATITPTMAANSVATAYTLTVKNGDAPNANYLKSVTVAIPANGGVPTSVTVGATSPANWTVEPTPLQGYLRFRECTANDACYGNSNNDVQPGGTITIQFTTTASETINNAPVNEVWTTTAFSDAVYTTALPLAGPEPTVAIATGAAITSANTTTFTNGTAGTFTVTTTGFPIPTLSAAGSLPSGVTFKDNGDGTATIAGTTQVAGNSAITITAHNGYGADATQTFTLTVSKATTTTTVSSSNLSSFSGQPVTFTATVVPGNSTAPTGTVQFQDGGTNLGSAVALSSGVGVYTAQLQTSTLSVGPHSITAVYTGDTNFLTSTSAALSQLVKSAITTTSISAPTITYGADGLVTVTVAAQDVAAGTPFGNVTLTVDTGSPISQALVNGSATFTISKPGAGDHGLTANFGAQNYFLASTATGTLHVNQAPATLAFDNLTFTYDGSAKPLSVTTTPSGLAGLTVTYSSGNPPVNAGSYNVSASLTNANYTATNITGIETIQAAPVVITVTDPMPTYDGKPHSANINTVPLVDAAITYNGLATLPTAAGTYTVSVMTANPNYAGAGSGTLTIKQAALTVTANDKTRSYGMDNPTFDGTITGIVSGDTITATYATTATKASPAGTYDITPMLSDAGTGALANYSIVSNKGTLTITAVPLYVIANDKSRIYGVGDPSFDAQYVGLVNGDTAASLGGPLSCTSNSNTTSLAGTYGIHCGGLSSIDYTIQYVNGTLSVTNPLNAITAINGASLNSETLTIGQTDTLTATGAFTDSSTRKLSVAGGTSYGKAPLSASLSGAAVAEAGGVLYAIGGFDGTNTLKTIQAYDPKNDMWSASSAALQTARSNAAVASVAGKIYVIGGTGSDGQALGSIEVLDTTGNTPSVSAYSTPLSTARSAAGAAAFNNKIYVIGGSDNSNNGLSSVEIFDLVTGVGSHDDAGVALSQASAAVVTTNNLAKLFVAGVSGSSVVVKSFDGVTWSNAINNSLAGASGVGAAALGGQLYIVNGPSMWSYDGTGFVQKNSLGNAHNGTQPVSIGSLIYAASVGSGTASSFVDAFAPDELKWTSADATKATVDQSGKITAIAITSPGAVVINAASLSDPTITAQFQLTIIKKTQTIQFGALGAKNYGDADFTVSATSVDSSSTSTGLLVGFTAGTADGCTVGGSTPAGGVSNATVHITGAGNCTITAAQPGDDTTWQAATSVPQTFAIAKAALTVSAADATRYYGVNNPTFTGTISGIQNGDNITATYASAATATSPVGAYPIVPTLVDPSGKLGNYNVSPTNGTLTVKAVAITVTADAQSKVYGDIDPALTYKVTTGALVNGDSFTGALVRDPGTSVGTYAIKQGSLALSTNYNLTYAGAIFTITPRPASVTPAAASKTYGTADPTFTGTLTGFITGDSVTATYTRTAGETVAGSPYAISATLAPATVLGNYNITYNTASFTINKANASVTPAAAVKTYGTSDPIFTGTLAGFIASDGVTAAYTRTAGETVAGSPYAISATLAPTAVLGNYNITYNTAAFTINKATASVSPAAASKTYGTSDPIFTGTLAGFIASDGVTAAYTRTAGETVAGSPYAISATLAPTAVLGNYNITYNTAAFTINKATASVSPAAASKTYGTSDPIFTGTLAGFIASDGVIATYTRTAGETVAGGPYAISATLTPATVLGNYNITYNTAAFTINKATASVSPAAASKTYGKSDPIFTGTLAGFIASDGVTATYARTAGETVAGSPYTISATLAPGAVLGNYNITYNTSSFTITPAPLSITASSGTMIYGGPVLPITASYSGFVNGDGSANLSPQPSCGSTATSLSPVGGLYVSSCTGAGDSNYNITYISGTVTVMPATTTTAVVSSSPNNTSTYMQLVTFTATVVPQYAGTTPTGTVTFYNNGSSIGTGTLSSSWCGTPPCADQAAFNISSLPDSGPDNITAAYGGDGNFVTSTSPAIIQTVLPAPNVSLSPMSLSFGNQNVNTTSRPAAVVLTNIGDATLNINMSGITISPNTDFAQTNNCGASVLPTKSCTISITFSPVDTGIRTAVLQITDNDDDASGAQQTVALTGSGLSTIPGTSLFTDAVFATANGCGSIVMSGGSTVDSFNSSQGYASSHTQSGGNVGTNGNVTLNGSKSAIYGSVAASSGSTGNCSKTSVTGVTTNGGAQVTGSVTAVNASISYPNPPAPNPAPPTTTQNISGSCGSVAGCSNTGSKAVSLMPGQYGNLTINGGTTAHFSHGTYNVNSLTLSGQSILLVDSGPIVINLAGASLSGGNPAMDATGGTIQNPTLTAENLQITYSGSRGLNLSGGTASYATVYAPNALVNMSGGTDFFGSIIASTVTNSGGTAIHYDSSLPGIASGNYIWFDAIANTVGGLPSNGAQVKLYLTNSSISFTANGTAYTVPVPNAVVTFNSASQTTGAKTSYDPVNSRWGTAVAKSGLTGNTFVTGVAFQLPANFPTGIQNATWSASYSTDTPGITLQWQWGAAVYSAFSSIYATTSPMNNNVLGVNPEDGTAGSDLAGTPENYKASVIFGATGGGGTNYTGYFSAAAGVVPTVAPMSVSPSSLDFGAQTQGSTSGAMTVTLTNNDSAAHIISSITPTGANASDFAVTNTCPIKPISLGTGSSCTITVIFTPSDVGTRTAKVGVNDDANNTPQTVYLSGAGQ